MVRQLATIFLSIVVLAGNADGLVAQGRGQGRRDGGQFGPSPARPAGPASSTFNRPLVRPPAPPPIGLRGRFTYPRVVAPQPRFIVPQPYIPFAGYSVYYPPYVPYVASPSIYTSPVYVAPAETPPSAIYREQELSYQVERLSREIEMLRQQQALAAATQQVSPPPPPEPPRPAVPITLVFRDGRRLTIQNYAIVGQTLWVLDEQQSTKIALSELDLAATQAENRGQGLRFPLLTK